MPTQIVKFSQCKDDEPLRVKLFGLGSAGCNMIEGVSYPTVAFSTSSADLARSHAERKMMIGPERLVGVTEAKHSILKHLPSIAGHEVVDVLNNTDIAFMFCGLGGVSGSLGVKLFSSIAQSKGTADIVLATTPFSAESIRRRELAGRVLKDVLQTSMLCIEFENDKLSAIAPNIPITRAFGLMNSIMQRPVMDACSTMTRIDVGALRSVISGASLGRFGLGLGRGDERVKRAVEEALSSPWFDFPLGEATAAIAIYSSSDPWDKEADAIASELCAKLPSARIAWGSYPDPSLNDRIRLSLVLCRRPQ